MFTIWAKKLLIVGDIRLIYFCFVHSFMWIYISFILICTVLLFVVFYKSEVLFLFCHSICICSICKFVRDLFGSSKWAIGFIVLILISYYWLLSTEICCV